MRHRVYLDSDVIVSSLLSNTGAAYFLLHQSQQDLYISNYSKKELELVVNRLEISKNDLDQLIQTLSLVKLDQSIDEIKEQYKNYVVDPADAHIIAGAVAAGPRFLITYNLKHYRVELIKRDFNILILTPALFLQYLRSQL
jgi:predicted nucleic acid-binding protein